MHQLVRECTASVATAVGDAAASVLLKHLLAESSIIRQRIQTFVTSAHAFSLGHRGTPLDSQPIRETDRQMSAQTQAQTDRAHLVNLISPLTPVGVCSVKGIGNCHIRPPHFGHEAAVRIYRHTDRQTSAETHAQTDRADLIDFISSLTPVGVCGIKGIGSCHIRSPHCCHEAAVH